MTLQLSRYQDNYQTNTASNIEGITYIGITDSLSSVSVTMRKVAIVTGASQGLGLAIVKKLCQQFDGDVYLTARNEEKGLAAVEVLTKEGFSPCFHQLDITDHDSIVKLHNHIKEKYGGLDLLVNNAGVANDSTMSLAEQAEVCLATNYTGTLDVCNVLFPLLRSHARVSTIASQGSNVMFLKASDVIQNKILVAKTIADVDKLMADFVQAAKDNKVEELGWPIISYGTYGASKVAVRMMTPIQQAIMDQDESRTDIIINSCCPGLISTNMTSYDKNAMPVEKGADTPVFCGLLPKDTASNPRGRYLVNRQVQAWSDEPVLTW